MSETLMLDFSMHFLTNKIIYLIRIWVLIYIRNWELIYYYNVYIMKLGIHLLIMLFLDWNWN